MYSREKAYFDILRAEPVVEKEFLEDILTVEGGITKFAITEVTNTNTARIIKIRVGCGANRKALFIKTSIPGKGDGPYRELNMRECRFYELVMRRPDALPLPKCHDVFARRSTGEFVIVLDDIAEGYHAPRDCDLMKKETWFACAEALGRLHAAFWNDGSFDQEETEDGEARRAIEKSNADLDKFLRDFGERLDAETVAILRKATEIYNGRLERPRRINTTLCSGDSHIHNFMLGQGEALMVDFQFWGRGLGEADLAHLTRVAFPKDFRGKFQMELARHYYDTLTALGVAGYSWQECLDEYRRRVATMVLMPLWQYCGYGIPYEDWKDDMPELIDGYKRLGCDEIA